MTTVIAIGLASFQFGILSTLTWYSLVNKYSKKSKINLETQENENV